MAAKPKPVRRKLFIVDASVLHALSQLARDTGETFNDLADIAFRDLLKKRLRPVSLKEALQGSVRAVPANDREPKRPRAKA